MDELLLSSPNCSNTHVVGSFLTTTLIYRKYMFMYGVLSVLHVLDYYVFEENYEECQKIIDAIKEQEEKLNTKLFTTITEQTIKEVKEVYSKFNLTGENALEHSKYYATLILEEINEKYVVAVGSGNFKNNYYDTIK